MNLFYQKPYFKLNASSEILYLYYLRCMEARDFLFPRSSVEPFINFPFL